MSADRDRGRPRIVQIVGMVPLQHRGLRRALGAFGGTAAFDVDAYVEARNSGDLDRFDKTALAERYWSVLQNLLRDLAQLGLAEAKKSGVHEVRKAGAMFGGLADLGVITREQADRLFEMQAIRNDDQHLYAAEIRRLVQAMLDLEALVPEFMASYGEWFESWPRQG